MYFTAPVIFTAAIWLTSCVCLAQSIHQSNLLKIESMIKEYEDKFPVPTVSVEQLQTWLQTQKDQVVVVDAREEEERNISMIPGAVSLSQFELQREQWKSRKVVAYCTVGYRSAKLVSALREKKIEAYNLRGSLLLWVAAGGRLVDAGGKETKNVHVYGEKWNILPDDYQGVWKKSWWQEIKTKLTW